MSGSKWIPAPRLRGDKLRGNDVTLNRAQRSISGVRERPKGEEATAVILRPPKSGGLRMTESDWNFDLRLSRIA